MSREDRRGGLGGRVNLIICNATSLQAHALPEKRHYISSRLPTSNPCPVVVYSFGETYCRRTKSQLDTAFSHTVYAQLTNSITIRPALVPPMVMSKKTRGRSEDNVSLQFLEIVALGVEIRTVLVGHGCGLLELWDVGDDREM